MTDASTSNRLLSPPTPPSVPPNPLRDFFGRYRVKKRSTTHFTSVDAIQAAIYADGSVSASFNVYVEFALCVCSVKLPRKKTALGRALTRETGTTTS